MRKMVPVGICILGFAVTAAHPQAHHAFAAEFDPDKVVTLAGSVVQMEWVSPHSWLTLEVRGKDGKSEQWSLEFGPPNALFRKGWRKGSLMPGMNISVKGFLSRDGRKVVNAGTVTLPDGRVLNAQAPSSAVESPPEKK
jgi:hypothetical protein